MLSERSTGTKYLEQQGVGRGRAGDARAMGADERVDCPLGTAPPGRRAAREKI